MIPVVDVVATATANLASVRAAFARLGAETRLATEPHQVLRARALVLPGVGAFGAAMGRVDDLGLRGALRRRVEENRPTLAICLGLQLLCVGSEEGSGARGLGLVPGKARRFSPGLRVPQLGWNRVEPDDGCELLEPGWAYFAHAYRLADRPAGWSCATTRYGGEYVSALELGAVLACQFHPELSGEWGAALLRRWLEVAS